MKEHAQRALQRLDTGGLYEHRALRLWLSLFTTTGLIEKQLRKRFRDQFDTTLPRFDVMAALARSADGQTMGELSRWLLVSSGNMTGIIRRLEQENLVIRTRNPHDRRTHYVKLSKKGREAFRIQSEAHELWVKEIFSGLSSEDMEALQAITRKTKQYLAASTTPL